MPNAVSSHILNPEKDDRPMKLQELKLSVDALQLGVARETSSALSTELNELTEAGGKKFRPGMLFLMGHLFNLKDSVLSTYARAVELTHLASLVHDDVIDESNTRRNHPTINSLKNNTTAILAGDYLLATVMRELAQTNNNDILIDLTLAIRDLADGEWLQFDLKKKEQVLFHDLEEIAIKKTGSLIRWCCTTPQSLLIIKTLRPRPILGSALDLFFKWPMILWMDLQLVESQPFWIF